MAKAKIISHMTKYGMKNKPSALQQLYSAELALCVEARTGKLNLVKSRRGDAKYDLSLKEAIDLLSHILCKVKYNGRMELFQAGMQQKLIEQITNTLKSGRW